MSFTTTLQAFASTCTKFATTISNQLGFGNLQGRTISDWRFATELKSDMLDLSKNAGLTQPELAKKIDSLAQKIVAEKENDLSVVVSELSAVLRAEDLSQRDYLKSRIVAFFLKYIKLVNDPKEQCMLTESPARVLPTLVMRYQSQTIEEMYSELSDTQWPSDIFDGMSEDVREAFYNCLKKPFCRLLPIDWFDEYDKQIRDSFLRSSSVVAITSNTALGLLHQAIRFRIEWLEKACVKFLSDSLTYENVLSFLEQGSTMNCSSLCTQCVAFLIKEPIPSNMKQGVVALARRFNYGILELEPVYTPDRYGKCVWKLDHGVEIYTSNDRDGLRTIHVQINRCPTSSLQKLLSCGPKTSPVSMHLHDSDTFAYLDPIRHNRTFLELIQYHSVVSFSTLRSCILSQQDLLLQALENNPNLKAFSLEFSWRSYDRDNTTVLSSLKALLAHPQITSFKINAEALERIDRDELLSLLEQNSTLKFLHVQCDHDKTHELQPTLYKALEKNRGLTHLSMDRYDSLGVERLPHFNFDSQNLTKALQANTKLTHLDLLGFSPDSSLSAHEALKACSKHPSLKKVKLGDLIQTDEMFTAIKLFRKENPQITLNFDMPYREPVVRPKKSFVFLRENAGTLLNVGLGIGIGLSILNIPGLVHSQRVFYQAVALPVTRVVRSLFLRFAQSDDRQLTANIVKRLQQNRHIVSLSEYGFWFLSSNLVGCISSVAALSLFNNLPALRALTALAGMTLLYDLPDLIDSKIFS